MKSNSNILSTSYSSCISVLWMSFLLIAALQISYKLFEITLWVISDQIWQPAQENQHRNTENSCSLCAKCRVCFSVLAINTMRTSNRWWENTKTSRTHYSQVDLLRFFSQTVQIWVERSRFFIERRQEVCACFRSDLRCDDIHGCVTQDLQPPARVCSVRGRNLNWNLMVVFHL